jgi:hypothetical protein
MNKLFGFISMVGFFIAIYGVFFSNNQVALIGLTIIAGSNLVEELLKYID